jgi:tetratricopeptide (TPR) repeat protein
MTQPFHLSALDRLFARIAVQNGYVSQAQVEACTAALAVEAAEGTMVRPLGSVLVDQGHLTDEGFREVLALQKKLQAQREQFAWSQIEIGDTYAGMAKLREAIDEYAVVPREYDEQREVCAVAHCKTGDALRRLGAYAEAIDTYEQVLHHYPDQEALRGPEILNKVGFCRRSLRRYDAALETFREILRRHANYEWYCAWALDGMADVHWDRGDTDAADAAWRDVTDRYAGLRDQGPLVVARFGLGLTGPEALLAVAPRLEMLLPDEVDCYLARRAEQQGDIQEARRLYKEVGDRGADPQWAWHVATESLRRLDRVS